MGRVTTRRDASSCRNSSGLRSTRPGQSHHPDRGVRREPVAGFRFAAAASPRASDAVAELSCEVDLEHVAGVDGVDDLLHAVDVLLDLRAARGGQAVVRGPVPPMRSALSPMAATRRPMHRGPVRSGTRAVRASAMPNRSPAAWDRWRPARWIDRVRDTTSQPPRGVGSHGLGGARRGRGWNEESGPVRSSAVCPRPGLGGDPFADPTICSSMRNARPARSGPTSGTTVTGPIPWPNAAGRPADLENVEQFQRIDPELLDGVRSERGHDRNISEPCI